MSDSKSGLASHDSSDSDLEAPSFYLPLETPNAATTLFAWPAATNRSIEFPFGMGDYQLLREIGRGGMGTVYLANSLRSGGGLVAMKLLNNEFAGNSTAVRRFQHEAELLRRIDHPNVVRLIDAGVWGGRMFLVNEYFEFGSLDRLLERGERLNEPIAIRTFLDLARALVATHESGLIHRDIKPANILIARMTDSARVAHSPVSTPEIREVKLTDFGLARPLERNDSIAITGSQAVIGTPRYMAPEQFRRATDVDPRADIYALGACMFHLLTGTPLFGNGEFFEIAQKHFYEPVDSADLKRVGVSESLIAILLKCLEKDPSHRYPTSVALVSDLERMVTGQPLASQDTPTSISSNLLEYEFEWELKSSRNLLWSYVSNTDRVNRTLGLPAPRFYREANGALSSAQIAEVKILGQVLRWREHPFCWSEPGEFSVLREFSTGPYRCVTSEVKMYPNGQGTKLVHRFVIEPNGWLGRAAAWWQIGQQTRRSLTRLYAQIDAMVQQEVHGGPRKNTFSVATPLSRSEQNYLTRVGRAMIDAGIELGLVLAMQEQLVTLADHDLARIRPKTWSIRLNSTKSAAVEAFLIGASCGMFQILWDVICPVSRVASSIHESIAAINSHSHCQVCDHEFAVDWARSVEMIFRVHPQIRQVDTRTYCIGGPFHAPHVHAQLPLEAGQSKDLELELSVGQYQIASQQLGKPRDFHVTADNVANHLRITLVDIPTQLPNSEVLLKVGHNRQSLTIVNNSDTRVWIRLEKVAGRELAITAAEAAGLRLFRRLFPGEVLRPDQLASFSRMTLLAARFCGCPELYRDLGEAGGLELMLTLMNLSNRVIENHCGGLVDQSPMGFLASFSTLEAAMVTAQALAQELKKCPQVPAMTWCINSGPVVVVNWMGRTQWMGSAVSRLMSQVEHLAQDTNNANRLYISDTSDQSCESMLGPLKVVWKQV